MIVGRLEETVAELLDWKSLPKLLPAPDWDPFACLAIPWRRMCCCCWSPPPWLHDATSRSRRRGEGVVAGGQGRWVLRCPSDFCFSQRDYCNRKNTNKR